MTDIAGDRMLIETKEIFKHLSQELYAKVPKKLRNFIESYKPKSNYTFNYDTTKKLDEQRICKETRNLIALLHYKYWSTDEERKVLKKILIENQKREDSKYSYENLFKRNSGNN